MVGLFEVVREFGNLVARRCPQWLEVDSVGAYIVGLLMLCALVLAGLLAALT